MSDKSSSVPNALSQLKSLATSNREEFFPSLVRESNRSTSFGEILAFASIRKRFEKVLVDQYPTKVVKLAIVGGASLRPLADLVEHFVTLNCGVKVELWAGDFDNYMSEVYDTESNLYEFGPDVILILPSESRCQYQGALNDPRSDQQAAADQMVSDLLELCRKAHEASGAAIVLANFRLPGHFDPGPLRHTSLGSDYGFKKYVNQQLGFQIPAFVHLCDVEFLSNRIGTMNAFDDRIWFESKQPYSATLMPEVAKEISLIIRSMTAPPKKVAVLDLDNTLWGGVIGDDGLEGIEIGTTSPRGEAFRAFQSSLLALSQRGILLAVCSKNDHSIAVEPFLKHPEMVLKLEHIVNFKANWEPKSENIRQIALELNLGLDSFVFLDDNPAEIEIVRQFAPEVSAICLGDDPSEFVAKLRDSRLFETRQITAEDTARSELYKVEAKRQVLQSTSTDMETYLASLEMVAELSPFTPVDVPRITQLINKSNQFNLTTVRRTESQVQELMNSANYEAFTIRLSDKFGAHGLIAVIVGLVEGSDFVIDTWLMSCRVLKRQVEQVTMNHIVDLAKSRGCDKVIGVYRATAKNGMVKNLFPSLDFVPLSSQFEDSRFALETSTFQNFSTHITVTQ